MSGDPFASGTGGNFASPAELKGKLLLFYVTDYLDGDRKVKTKDYGEKDAVVADVHDVETGEVYDGSMFLQGKIIGTLKRHVGKKPFLGRMDQSAEKIKGNKAWILADPTDADKKKALAYIETLKGDDESPFS